MSVTAKDAGIITKTNPPIPEAQVDAPSTKAVEELSDPRELLIRKPMPHRRHTVTRADGVKQTILLQGLSYLEKQKIDARSRARRVEDEEAIKRGELETARPSLWAPEIFVTAMCKPNGGRVYAEEQIKSAALQFAEQLADGELQAAADVVLDLSGWGEDGAMRAGKASKRTPTTAS